MYAPIIILYVDIDERPFNDGEHARDVVVVGVVVLRGQPHVLRAQESALVK